LSLAAAGCCRFERDRDFVILSPMSVSLSEICRLVSLQLGIKGVQGPDLILEELGAASIDVIHIVATIEESYDIEIDEAELADIRSVADLYHLVQRLTINAHS
jgi:acyl carrier protein